MVKTEIKIGQEWIVDSNHFMAFPNLNKRKSELIDNGTKFKIIHVEEWHFITNSGKVYFAKSHEILEHCKLLDDSFIIDDANKKNEIHGAYVRKTYKKSVRVESVKRVIKNENIRD